jgi:acyl carrier protein
MNRKQILTKLAQIIEDVIGEDAAKIDESSSPDTISDWDSMRHVSLIAAIEESFGITLDPADAAEMLNVDLILDILEEKMKD